jgi:hypothetical protein
MRSIELTVLIMMMPGINDDHISIHIVLLRQHKTCDTYETVRFTVYRSSFLWVSIRKTPKVLEHEFDIKRYTYIL